MSYIWSGVRLTAGIFLSCENKLVQIESTSVLKTILQREQSKDPWCKIKKSCMPVGTQKRKGFFSLTIWKVTMARDKTPLFYLSQAAFKYAQTLIDHRCIK